MGLGNKIEKTYFCSAKLYFGGLWEIINTVEEKLQCLPESKSGPDEAVVKVVEELPSLKSTGTFNI